VRADVLLALILKKRSEISFKELLTIFSEIRKISPHIPLEISESAFNAAVYRYPFLFYKDIKNKCFRRAKDSEQYYNSDYIEDEFLFEISEEVRKTLERALKRLDDSTKECRSAAA